MHLAFSEIRFYGAENIRIARRWRAMIINLADTLPAQRHPALHQELDLLDPMIEKPTCFLRISRSRESRTHRAWADRLA